MKNKKKNLFLAVLVLVVLVVVALIIFGKNGEEQEPIETNDVTTEGKLFDAKGFSFRHDEAGRVETLASDDSESYMVGKAGDEGYVDFIHFYKKGFPTEKLDPCFELGVPTPLVIGGKDFTLCATAGEPVRSYVYSEGEKTLVVSINMTDGKPETGYINLSSIDIK